MIELPNIILHIYNQFRGKLLGTGDFQTRELHDRVNLMPCETNLSVISLFLFGLLQIDHDPRGNMRRSGQSKNIHNHPQRSLSTDTNNLRELLIRAKVKNHR